MVISLKKNQGITLVALVITIIVLLILAGVAITTLSGKDNIITQAQRARDEYNETSIEEVLKLNDYYNMIDKHTGTGNGADSSSAHTGKIYHGQLYEYDESTDTLSQVETWIYVEFGGSSTINFEIKNENGETQEAEMTVTQNPTYELINKDSGEKYSYELTGYVVEEYDDDWKCVIPIIMLDTNQTELSWMSPSGHPETGITRFNTYQYLTYDSSLKYEDIFM